MAHFQSQNRKIASGALNGTHAKYLHLDTLGLSNGCVDSKIEAPFYPEMAFNNTYGFPTIPEEVYIEAKNNLTKKGGCNDLIDQCRLLALSDPENIGTNDTVNAACASATMFCYEYVQGAYTAVSGVSRITFLTLKTLTSVAEPFRHISKTPLILSTRLHHRVYEPRLGAERTWCAIELHHKLQWPGEYLLRSDGRPIQSVNRYHKRSCRWWRQGCTRLW
jgi:hypothetical protein